VRIFINLTLPNQPALSLLHQLLSLLFWAAFWSVFRALYKTRGADASTRIFLSHYLRVIVPLGILFLILVLREVLPLGFNRFLVGINFIIAGLLIAGRFQYIRYVVLGNKFKAYSNYFEYIPIATGIFGYALSQLLVYREFENGYELETLLTQAFALSQELVEVKFIYLVLLNVDLLLLIRQFEIVKGIKGRTRIERSVIRIHALVAIGFVWRFLSFIGVFIGSAQLYNTGMLLTLVVLGLILVFLLFFTVEELPNWANEAKEIENLQNDLWKEFLEYLEVKKPFLSKSLQMQDVAIYLGVREAELRATLQLNSSLNFPELINAHRLHHLLSLELLEHQKGMSSEEMADACGFNSRSTLFRTSKKWLNRSASQIKLGKDSFDLKLAIRKSS